MRWPIETCFAECKGELGMAHYPTTTRPLPSPGEVPGLDSHPSLPRSRAQVRLLLRVALPQPVLDVSAALAVIAYQQRHNYAAYCSHRKRLLAQLQGLRW